MPEPIIRTQHLHRIYRGAGTDVHAINDVSLEIQPGMMTAVVGRSGAGKTTLLNLLCGLDEPDEGQVWVHDTDLYTLSEVARTALRREKIGFIFQHFGLLPLLSAAENVSVPLRMRHLERKERERRVLDALESVGLRERAKHRPYELSGGEQQRVAIARALVAHPEIILADEPTGQLDSHTGRRVLNVMRRLASDQGLTIVIVTHDPQAMDEADVIYQLHDGRLVES
ncbi:MAG: ABC transporter ATP-binding protein [Anaerolineaceae bacterium]|nr:ABC transporter ATP-binding protein [Anaerolineaceae bacterium]